MSHQRSHHDHPPLNYIHPNHCKNHIYLLYCIWKQWHSLSLALYPSSTVVIVSREATILGLSSNTTILVKTPCHSQGWSTILILPGTHSRSRRFLTSIWAPGPSYMHLEPILQYRQSNLWIPFHASDYSNKTGLDKQPSSELIYLIFIISSKS